MNSAVLSCRGNQHIFHESWDHKIILANDKLSHFSFPQVKQILAREASLCWSAPVRKTHEEHKEGDEKSEEPVFSYEVFVSFNGKDGKYNTAYR